MVLGRGNVPCEVLFCGEAPGESEDILGAPFVGTAGRLFDREILAEAVQLCGPFRFAITNLVACVPWEHKLSSTTRDPSKEEIEACSPRLVEFYQIARPKLIVTLGELAGKWVPKLIDIQMGDPYLLKLPHPAAIARSKTQSQKTFLLRQCAVRISSMILYARNMEKSNDTPCC